MNQDESTADSHVSHAQVRKVLLLSFTPFMGGGEVYVERLAALLQPSAELFFVCASADLHEKLRRQFRHVYLLPQGRLNRYRKLASALFLVPWLVLRHDIRRVHLNGPTEAWFAPLLQMLSRRVVLTRHINLGDEDSRPKQALYRRNARYADVVVCVSKAIADQHRSFLPPSKIMVIPNWSPDVDASSRSRRPLQKKVLFVGRLLKRKGLQVLISAMKHMPDWELVIAGDGGDRVAFEQQALGLHATFLGFVAEPSHYYDGVDFLVNPALGPEGSPLVSIEAMAHGMPCIMSDLSPFREVTDDGKAAMLFPVGDAEALLDCMQKIAADASLRETLAANARDLVQRCYSPDVARPAYLRAFNLNTPDDSQQ